MKKMIAWLKTLKGFIAALTAVLVVLPALVHSGIDVYNAVYNIPKGIKEKNNAELFQKHFRESPVFTAPVTVKGGGDTRQVSIDVYGNGDIFVLYGTNGQWFPFSAELSAPAALLVRAAYAGPSTAPVGSGSYVQTVTMDNGTVTQERIYANGVKETVRLDKNSGRILSRQTSTASAAERKQAGQKGIKQAKPTVVNIDAIKGK